VFSIGVVAFVWFMFRAFVPNKKSKKSVTANIV
jgi:hypothetical protein